MASNPKQGASIRLSRVTLKLPTFFQHQKAEDSWLKTLFGAAIDRPDRRLNTILSDIDFEANDGDRIALIGRNGAGKTSLLHLLTGCYLPTEGEVEIHGSRQALLNVSLGFNPEATLRENIFLRGAAMGAPMHTIRDSVGSILEFAELGALAGRRLATLSAGQRMRLGFAISTSVQPDIMLLDEWIGTGDAQFIKRARERMQDRVSGSRIMVLASHSDDLVRRVCNRGLVLEAGRVVFDGAIKQALDHYRHLIAPKEQPAAAAAAPAFVPQRLAHATGHGIRFAKPPHRLFENLGEGRYGFTVEIHDDTLANALASLSASLAARGLRPSAFASTTRGLPNVFEFTGAGGATARVTLTAYVPNDTARQAPGAVGRIHFAMVDAAHANAHS
ncbi:ABC transporter ATP-binding protein [Noviluteimonas gilva]|uniref:ATP-binding cassette domain-containing protein n=1 Tax=Noviluteimonas gilva TaxID=2682097 RepID=A0A7C9M303_9GAMM|nr:ATP-binding cassette domain-containing protein [Lysobacter gilvus]MUV13722.1 ATP-binding cassette domain-containing protein [Lysobacter gilvus]